MGLFSNKAEQIEQLQDSVRKLQAEVTAMKIYQFKEYRYSALSSLSSYSQHREFDTYELAPVLEKVIRHLGLKLQTTAGTSATVELVPLDTIKVNKPKKA